MQPEAIEYAKRRMRSGPYYDRYTKTLRIPHRWSCRRAKSLWQKCKMIHDTKRFEFYRSIPAKCADDQVAKARRVFFSVYAAEFPEEYLKFVQQQEAKQ